MISFFIHGHPKTAGSKRAFMPKGWSRPIIVDDCKKGKDWRGDVKAAAIAAYQGPPFDGPLSVEMVFHMARPKGHFRTGKNVGNLRDNCPTWHTSKPDALKMARAIEDALTGILWRDDSQIVIERLEKIYSAEIGCRVDVKRIGTVRYINTIGDQMKLSIGSNVT